MASQSAGLLFALLSFLIFPVIWAVPESLITAELSTAMPGNGGFVVWADRAFGPFSGSLMGAAAVRSILVVVLLIIGAAFRCVLPGAPPPPTRRRRRSRLRERGRVREKREEERIRR
jgi:amino acid transporter